MSKRTNQTTQAQAVEAIQAPATYPSLCPGMEATIDSLLQTKGNKSRRLTFLSANLKGGSDCAAALVLVQEVIFERIERNAPAFCLKGELVSLIGRQTGIFAKHNPDSPLHQGLNKLGGNQFNFSKDKSGERDTWGITPREDGRPVLFINGRMSENTGEIFFNPVVWAMGGYSRPTADQVKSACDHMLRKFKR